MEVKIEDVSSIRKKLVFEISADKVDQEIEKAYQKIGRQAKVKGFRPGKVPRSVLEKYYAPQMEEQVLGRLINDSYFKALTDHAIPAVSDPEIVDSTTLEKGKAFTYEAQVEIRPEVEARDYEGLRLKKERFDFDPQVVEDQLEQMRQSRAELVTVEREELREGDFAVIDYRGTLDGEPFEGGTAEGQQIEIGSGSLIPGFEEQLIGMKQGEERTIEVTFPADYGNKELAGQPARFEIRLGEIKEKRLPELDDAFAKEYGLESLEQMRERLEENHRRQETERIDSDLRERLVDALIERNPIEVPSAMVDQQLEQLMENAKQRLGSQGMSLEMLGLSEATFRAQYRPAAVRQVQGGLLLAAVNRQEELKVEDEEIEERIAAIVEQGQAPEEAVKKHFAAPEARRQLASQIAEAKVMKLLLEKAEIEEVAAEDLKPATEAAEKEA